MKHSNSTQRGNALWFILVGVALLGALTIILSRSGSTVDQTGDFEQRSIQINRMLRYAKSIEAAVQEMRLRGVSENEISFQNTVTTADYTNANCDDTADRNFPDCMVFDVGGAGLSYQDAPEGINDGSEWIFNARNIVDGVGDNTKTDLIMVLTNVRDTICTQINRELDESFGGPENGVNLEPFAGQYLTGQTINFADGRRTGCLQYDNGTITAPLFYYVLIER